MSCKCPQKTVNKKRKRRSRTKQSGGAPVLPSEYSGKYTEGGAVEAKNAPEGVMRPGLDVYSPEVGLQKGGFLKKLRNLFAGKADESEIDEDVPAPEAEPEVDVEDPVDHPSAENEEESGEMDELRRLEEQLAQVNSRIAKLSSGVPEDDDDEDSGLDKEQSAGGRKRRKRKSTTKRKTKSKRKRKNHKKKTLRSKKRRRK